MFVKICGIRSREAANAAVTAGADAIGFVFTASTRQVSVERARELCKNVPNGVLRIAVTRHPSAELCREILAVVKPDCFQTDAEDLASIELPGFCEPLPVYRNGRVPEDAELTPRLLFEGHVSGSGQTADWNEAAALARKTQLILAGGLTPRNVTDAIAAVRPWGVDVSSGVESSPGVKDIDKIHEFVARARAMEKTT